MKNWFFAFIVYFFLICILLCFCFLYLLYQWGFSEIDVTESKIVELQKNESLVHFSQKLYALSLIDNSFKFRLWVRIFSDYSKFQAGTYKFEYKISPYKIISDIKLGKIYEPIVIKYTIPECFTLDKIISRLTALGIGTRQEFVKLSRSRKFLQSLNIPADYLEGYFYPSTYSFTYKITPEEAIQTAVNTFWKNLPKNYESQVQALGLSLHEAVIFASLIEAETMHLDEKPLISEVIWNRLKRNMPLAIDAALIYGIKDYKGDIKSHHLKDKTNPYNTRLRKGLPPTPICSPSASALKAVVSFSNYGYLYYVVSAEDNTRHVFSRTLEEHNKNVKKLIKYQKAQN